VKIIITSTVPQIVGYSVGFVSKSTFCLRALEPVRNTLEVAITYFAVQRFGAIAGPIMGQQLALVFTFPVTNVLGDIVGTVVGIVVEKVIVYVMERFFKKPPATKPQKNYRVPLVLSYVVGFCSRNYFSIKAVPYTETGLTFIFTRAAVAYLQDFSTGTYVGTFVGVQLARTFTFPVAQMAGEIVGYGCQITSLKLGNYVWARFFDRSPLPSDDPLCAV
jgi:hypothetical protein